ncbi:EamA family transporter [Rhodobacterales bacterium HKCCE3408]|nr:EamA family transporter [Rhodobacterales bacterium HKCCE3408]
MTPNRSLLVIALVAIGAAWGVTQPLSKIAVSEGYRHFGIIFWQLALGAVILGVISHARGRPLSLAPRHLVWYALIALLGTLLPNGAGYTAAVHLPSGILSIVLSTVPMVAFPIALAMGADRFSAARFAGLCLGLAAILLIALPEASLPEPGMVAWLPVALIAPALYALEGNIVGRYGTGGLDPVSLLYGASVVGVILSLPVALATGTFISPLPPWSLPDLAIVLTALAHAAAYSSYVWLVGQAGAVFAAQVSYLVTGFGIVWAKILLGENYSGWVWAAIALMFAGLALVQPRPREGIAEPREVRG